MPADTPSQKPTSYRRSLVLLLCFLAGCGSPKGKNRPSIQEHQPPAPLSVETWYLAPGFSYEGTIATDRAVHAFSLEAGEFLYLTVEQLGVDLVVDVSSVSKPNLLLRVDSPTGPLGIEDVFLHTESATELLLEVRPWNKDPKGRYRIRVVELHRATPSDQKRAQAASLFSRAMLLADDDRSAVEPVTADLTRAAELWGQLGDAPRQARSLFELGRLYDRSATHRDAAVANLAQALDLYRLLSDRKNEAKVLHQLGRVWRKLDDTEKAQDFYEKALDIWRELGNKTEQAALLNDLANLHSQQSKVYPAIECYNHAIEIYQDLGNRKAQATARSNLGYLYMTVGERRLATSQYRQALELLNGESGDAQRAVTLSKLGDVQLHLEGAEAALSTYEEALTIRRQLGDSIGEAVTLNSVGLADVMAGRPALALPAFREALAIFGDEKDTAGEMVVLANLAFAYERLGRLGEAQQTYRDAFEMTGRSNSPNTEIEILFGLARVERSQGQLYLAKELLNRALERIETIRHGVDRPDLQSSYLAIRQGPFELMIDLLADLEAMKPGVGHAREAFIVSERARARSMLDSMHEVRATLESTADSQLVGRLERLADLITLYHRTYLEDKWNNNTEASDTVATKLEQTLEEYRQTELEVRRRHPRYAAWVRPRILSIPEVRKEIVDKDTLILEYFLGEEHSYLWAIDADGEAFYRLPAREQIEKAVLFAYEKIKKSHHQVEEVAARLAMWRVSELLLKPVAEQLQHQRLVVVAPGALQYLPFAALIDPRKPQEQPLVVGHEIISLPSASVLAALRLARSDRPPAAKLLAVVADPAFHGHETSAESRFAMDEPPPPLPYAREEAEVILRLADALGAPEGSIFKALGSDADKQLALSGSLSEFRLLHFASHGYFDTQHPELSSILLSTRSADGQSLDGRLRAYEIYRLRFVADLVTLSACETALGRDVRGEGLIGLTHGFMDAGAASVLVSLWRVHDRSTAELMERFYRHLLLERQSPARALQLAQASMWREKRWKAPYYWAGFVLQGDWETRPLPSGSPSRFPPPH